MTKIILMYVGLLLRIAVWHGSVEEVLIWHFFVLNVLWPVASSGVAENSYWVDIPGQTYPSACSCYATHELQLLKYRLTVFWRTWRPEFVVMSSGVFH